MNRLLLMLALWGGMAAAQQSAAPTPLPDLLKEAREKSPAILAAIASVKTAAFAPAQAGALPDTEFMVQTLSAGDPRPFAGFRTSDFAYIGFGVAQEIPYPGKRALRREVAGKETDLSRAEVQMTLADVLLQVKLDYFALARTQSVLGLLERNREVVGQLEQAVHVRYSTGSGTQQDVLRAQLERTRLLNEIAVQKREAAQLQARLRGLLDRPADSPDIVAEALRAPQPGREPPALEGLAENPELGVQHVQIAKAAAEIALAKREKRPDFGVQYMWQHTSDNFRDYYMATFSLRLPDRKRVNAAVSQAEARKAQTEAMQTAEHRRLQAQLEQETAALRSTEEQLRIYREGLVPQSEAAFNAGMAGYRTGKQDYQSLLASYADTVRLGIEYQGLLEDHERTVARIERLTGGGLK